MPDFSQTPKYEHKSCYN